MSQPFSMIEPTDKQVRRLLDRFDEDEASWPERFGAFTKMAKTMPLYWAKVWVALAAQEKAKDRFQNYRQFMLDKEVQNRARVQARDAAVEATEDYTVALEARRRRLNGKTTPALAAAARSSSGGGGGSSSSGGGGGSSSSGSGGGSSSGGTGQAGNRK